MKKFREWICKLKFKRKVRKMDEIYKRYCGSCFGLFPPSFYYTHTPDEIKKMKEEYLSKLREMIDEFEKKNT